jgi:hypothetical protein
MLWKTVVPFALDVDPQPIQAERKEGTDMQYTRQLQ